jgi:hypothetical protein
MYIQCYFIYSDYLSLNCLFECRDDQIKKKNSECKNTLEDKNKTKGKAEVRPDIPEMKESCIATSIFLFIRAMKFTG